MKKIILAMGTGLGLGYAPKAPGTVGSLLGVLLVFLFPRNGFLGLVLVLLGLVFSHLSEKILGETDSPKIVIDEIAGMFIACFGFGSYYVIPGFILFRIFDILKPGPIKNLQDLPGGLGVMADDIAAGLISNVILQLAVRLLHF